MGRTAEQMIAEAQRDADRLQLRGTMEHAQTHVGLLQGYLRGQEYAYEAPAIRSIPGLDIRAAVVPFGDGQAVAHYEFTEAEPAVNDAGSPFTGPGFPAEYNLLALYVRGQNVFKELDSDQIARIEEVIEQANPVEVAA